MTVNRGDKNSYSIPHFRPKHSNDLIRLDIFDCGECVHEDEMDICIKTSEGCEKQSHPRRVGSTVSYAKARGSWVLVRR